MYEHTTLTALLGDVEALAAQELACEYLGEVIRRPVADQRERRYAAKGLGCFFFQMDEDHILDATCKGGLARFINHSCNPNCVARAIELGGLARIFIITIRAVTAGEELVYVHPILNF